MQHYLKLIYLNRKELEKMAAEIMADSGYDRYCYVPDRVSCMTKRELIQYIEGE
jgi:hypothetical protein